MIPSSPAAHPAGPPADDQAQAEARASGTEGQTSRGGPAPANEAILCNHCGRTASNGISCIGACVADSGY